MDKKTKITKFKQEIETAAERIYMLNSEVIYEIEYQDIEEEMKENDTHLFNETKHYFSKIQDQMIKNKINMYYHSEIRHTFISIADYAAEMGGWAYSEEEAWLGHAQDDMQNAEEFCKMLCELYDYSEITVELLEELSDALYNYETHYISPYTFNNENKTAILTYNDCTMLVNKSDYTILHILLTGKDIRILQKIYRILNEQYDMNMNEDVDLSKFEFKEN